VVKNSMQHVGLDSNLYKMFVKISLNTKEDQKMMSQPCWNLVCKLTFTFNILC
jgi:hypothetical protein